ncbi:MAG: sulfurtransferase [Burkholderiaceae bacterium]
MNPAATHPLTSAAELAAALAGPRPPVVIEASFDLAEPTAGERAWQARRLPGSVYLHLERDLSGPQTDAAGRFHGRHPLPDRRAFAATLARAGVTPDRPVVVLDRQGSVYAARLWWMLRWMGHADVAVLDGGLAAWTEAGGATTTEPPADGPDARTASLPAYPARTPLLAWIEVGQMAEGLGRWRVIDARAPERFRGDVEPLDRVAGHIPGALNRCFKDNLAAGGRFKPADVLRSEFEPLVAGRPAAEIVHQCGSGVTACHNLLAMEHAGWHGSTLYPGSWSEWSADPARPVARG